MNALSKVIFLAMLITVCCAVSAQATLPTFDAVNAALSEIRNALMQSQFAQDIALAIEQLAQLKAQYLELVRFHAGIDEMVELFVGDPLERILGRGYESISDAFEEFWWVAPQIEVLKGASGPREIRSALEEITGALPESADRPYIPFEELQVVEGFQLAREIREAGRSTREAARLISDQAKLASPKGAARLQAQAAAEAIVLAQENQEAMAKLLELQATQVEQVSRDEKRLERERLKYMADAAVYLQAVLQE